MVRSITSAIRGIFAKKSLIGSGLIFIFNAILIAVGIFGILKLNSQLNSNSSTFEYVDDQEVFAATEQQQTGFVDISGQIKKPGLYEFNRGERVMDLVEKAGGFTSSINLIFVTKCLNLSSKLNDEQKIYLPAKNEIFPCNDSIIEKSDTQESGSKININTASESQIENLPGIGPTIAKRIIEARPYKKVEDLKNVKGIGDSLFSKLKGSVTL